MDVIFQPSRGNPFYIEVGYFDTVLEIKEKIQKDHGIPVSKQTLIFNGNILHDDLNVHNSDILDQSRIHLLLASDALNQPSKTASAESSSSSSKIQLLLKLPAAKLGIALEMDAGETVQRLREKIHDMEGIPINRLVIHANGIELHDHKSMQDCELSDNSEIDVTVQSAPPATTTTSSRSSSGNVSASRKLVKVIVLNKNGTEKIPVEVNPLENVVELRKKLQKLKVDLPPEGYFFIYKQNVMDDDRSFRWHHVGQGDVIEIFSGIVSGGS